MEYVLSTTLACGMELQNGKGGGGGGGGEDGEDARKEIQQINELASVNIVRTIWVLAIEVI